MDATQVIGDSVLESDEEENEEEDESKRGRPLAKLSILKNQHIPETDLPLFLGDNVLGRDPNTCTLPLTAPSISKQHATISISVYRRRSSHSDLDVEALVWDVGSMNGTRKGRLKLTPNVRYALNDGDSLVVADIPCRYVSCALDTVVSSQGDLRTSGSRNSEVKGRLPDALGEKGGDKSADSKKSVNSGAKVRVSSLKTPVRAGCLSFEQTPTQPQGILVPESDSDSDGERRGRGDGRRMAQASDSESHKSSPTCSTFLSPTNKIVPESEDESPITPTSSTKKRPHKHVSFSREEAEVDAHGQLLEEKKALAFVHDSEEEGGTEEERAAPGDKSEKSGQHVPVKEQSNASVTGHDELPVSPAAVSTDAIPAFNMNSDTDIEGEDEGVASVGPVTSNTNQVSQPPNAAQFHMDSDTDVEEDEDTADEAPKTVPTSVNSFIEPEEMTVDSDTDVDDDDAVSEAATKAKPLSFQAAHKADTACLTQPKDFHLDSDTDVDEEEEEGCETNKPSSKIEGAPTRLTGPESAPVPVNSLHLDSDTDDEAIPAPAIGDSMVAPAATESRTTADGGTDVLSDSDTDVDDDSPLVIPVEVTALSGSPGTMSEVLESDSNDTDVGGCSMPPAGEGANPPDFRVDSDTDVEDKETDKDQNPSPCREKTPDLQVPVQNCSTPAQLLVPEENVEVMETQAFLNPSSIPFKCATTPVVRPATSSPCSDSQEDEDLVVAETQSFILQTRDCKSKPPEVNTTDLTKPFCLEPSDVENDGQSTREGSFQLGLSDSSHLQCPAQALAMESTQAFASTDWRVTMEDTQAYAAVSPAENDVNLEATQPYGQTEELTRCSTMSKIEPQTDLALEATQVYTSEHHSDSESETDDDDRKHSTATAETQPVSIPTTCTHPVPQKEAGQPQQRPRSELLCAETQPMSASDDNESDDEDLIPLPQRRKAGPLRLEEEQTQPLIRSDISVVETQPMATSENEDSDDGDSIPIFRGKRAKPLQLECTQSLSCSEVSATETQPMHLSAKTQPMGALEGEQSDEEDLTPAPRKRKAKALQIEEEQTQPLISETQPIVTGEENESGDEDPIPGSRKRRAKAKQLEEDETQPLTTAEVSAVETQPMEIQPEAGTSGVSVRNKRGTRARLREEEEQAERSEPPKRQTRGKKKVLTTTRGRTGKSRPDEDESEEEEKVEQARSIRGKKPMRQQKHDEEKREQCKMEGDEHAENSSLIKEKQEVRLEKEIERKKKEEQERLQTERIRLEHERAEKQRKEQEEKERSDQLQKEKEKQLEKERKEREEKERLERDKAEQEKEKLDRERIEKERKEQEEKERLEREKRELEERLERERKEQELQERLQRERLEKEKRELEERLQREKEEQELQERLQRERLEKEKRELEERLQREREEQELQERLQRETKEREERERLEKEKRELEERLQREKEEQELQERLEREKKEREERERLEKEKRKLEERLQREKEEQELQERLEREKKERERLEKEKRELEERLQREKEEQELQERLQRETKEREEKERLEKEQENKEEVNSKGPTRGRRAARRTVAAPCTTVPEQDSTIPTNDDVPARRTRSRSNSSNSVSSERSTSSVNTLEGRGRGRGRGRNRSSEPPQATTTRASRRRTVAAETTERNSDNSFPQGVLSRSNSTNSLHSDISSCSVSSQNRGRGSRQRESRRKMEPELDSIPPVNSHDWKPAAKGRSSKKTEGPQEDEEKAESQQASTTRGRRRASAHGSEPRAAGEDQPNEEEDVASKVSSQPKRNVRSRGQKLAKTETTEVPVAPAVSDGDESKDKRKGRKRELEANTVEESSSSSKISKGTEKAQTTETTEEEARDEENAVQAKRRGRASSARAKKSAKDSPDKVEAKEESEKLERDIVEKKAKARPSAVQKKKKEDKESGANVSSMTENATVEASEPQTPTTSASRKRQAPTDSSPVAKTPRSSRASLAASGGRQAASQAYKVLFTGVVDEAGERVLSRLGGSMAKGVADMNCLVTDKVRRTVKFLCAVAKGIPIVTTQWLEKSGKAGCLLPPDAFLVKDLEQEKKFSFCLQESLRMASSQPLLQGYEIHVTKSVKPEPVHMKDIISCSGATFLPKMPSTPKPQTVVVSCEENWSLCGPAVSASLPVVTAEFILTGILQQKVDVQTHGLSGPVANLQPAGGRGRGRRKM